MRLDDLKRKNLVFLLQNEKSLTIMNFNPRELKYE